MARLHYRAACASGKTLLGKSRVLQEIARGDNAFDRSSSVPDMIFRGEHMDLAMAMGLTLFGMFTGSTVLFFYRLGR
jgi:hypothetical protein